MNMWKSQLRKKNYETIKKKTTNEGVSEMKNHEFNSRTWIWQK